MTRKTTTALIILLALVVAGAVVYVYGEGERGSADKNVSTSSEVTGAEAREDTITPVVESMTLEEKVGQMLLLGTWNQDHIAGQKQLVSEGIIGSVILMDANIGTKEETSEHISNLQSLVPTSTPPLLVAVDQEGGIVSRFEYNDFELTAQPDIENAEEAKSVASRRAREISELGVNVNFAPVLEYITDPDSFLYDRTFRVDEKSAITPLGSAMVEGYQREGVAATIKHFPGHTDSSVDSHKNLPKVAGVSRTDLRSYASPFIEVLDEARPDLVMTAHVLFPEIDREYPATLSERIISDFLKDEVGFTRVVITDDMNMGAITNGFGRTEAAIRAVNAGNDILLYVATPAQVRQVHTALVQAVRSGNISEERINDALLRIVALKQKYVR